MINIIIPAYNSYEDIVLAISSIRIQDYKDIIVSIVNDASTKDYNYLSAMFPDLSFRYINHSQNMGCGQSRQSGIDNCNEKFFMFLDTDDLLYVPNSLREMTVCMEQYNLDILITTFLEERENHELLIHKNETIHMHGKLFRTEYIKKNNIKFNLTRMHEDHSFNNIAIACGGNIKFVDIATYYWKYNRNSLTRKFSVEHSNLEYLMEYFTNAKYTIDELKKRGVSEDFQFYSILNYMFSFFKYFNIIIHNKACKADIDDYIKFVKAFLKDLSRPIYNRLLSLEYIQDYYENQSIVDMIDNNIVPVITYYDFMNLTNPYLS